MPGVIRMDNVVDEIQDKSTAMEKGFLFFVPDSNSFQ